MHRGARPVRRRKNSRGRDKDVCGEAHGDTASALTVFRLTCQRLLQHVAPAILSRRTCAALFCTATIHRAECPRWGQKQTLQSARPMSALPPKADIADSGLDVR